MDNKYYDYLFGKEKTTSIYPSHETKNKSNWVIYSFNTITSLAYITNSIIVFLNAEKLFIINYYGAILSLILGVASFFWWASQRDLVQKLDIGVYSSLIFWPGIIVITSFFEEIEFSITWFYFILTLMLIYVLYDFGVNKKYITILNLLGILFSSIIIILYITPIYFYRIILYINIIFLGFILKLFDTYKVVDDSYGSGTGWFHLFTALGLILVWTTL